MKRLLTTTITSIFIMGFSNIVTAGDHVDDERMDEHHTTTGAPAIKMERLPAQILLNAKACEGKSLTYRVMDQTDGSMVTCSEARKEREKLDRKINNNAK